MNTMEPMRTRTISDERPFKLLLKPMWHDDSDNETTSPEKCISVLELDDEHEMREMETPLKK